MEISQLRYFLKVAERQSFTHAGEELLVSQSALSRSIAKLEQEIGQPVFERQSRSLVLTDAGRMLKVRAEQILSLVEDTLAEITDDGESGRIRVGAIPTIAPFLLPAVLREFRTRFPRATVIVFEETTDKLLQRCHQGEVDVALLAAPIPKQHLAVEPLFEEELLLVLPDGHPLVDRKSVTIADIDGYPFVLLDETHCLSDNIVSYCRHRSFQPVSVERTSQLATVQELVTLGHGISLIPRMARAVDSSERRNYRSLAEPKPARTIVLAWNPYRFQSRIADRFKDCVREIAPEFGKSATTTRTRGRAGR
ncbi:LysR family transcriptional regulator [Planctellipticum variicoloris]|uniref:LysR family transcriptional regulator n=1 Tax=Planctellipticum variicoloris TaxID=3064265 RepID=UPI00301379A1|nr:LysR family transcriptional regulator [Planctomycetaceae bacterium SH412]